MGINGAAAFQMHANHIRISQQVMQIPQGLLIGSYQEYAYVIIVLAGFDGMQGEGGCHVLTVNEMVYLSVAIARNIRQYGLIRGPLIQTVQRHHGEKLADGPGIRKRLEQ